MTSVKMFVIGALLGTLFGATFLGAISHLLIIVLAVVGTGALAMAGRRRQLGQPRRKDLSAPPAPEA
jgi:uncharacterized membrane protein YdjX (TVP38/TMEM64 family)